MVEVTESAVLKVVFANVGSLGGRAETEDKDEDGGEDKDEDEAEAEARRGDSGGAWKR